MPNCDLSFAFYGISVLSFVHTVYTYMYIHTYIHFKSSYLANTHNIPICLPYYSIFSTYITQILYHIHTKYSYIHTYIHKRINNLKGEENEMVTQYVQAIVKSLKAQKIRVKVDDRPNMR